jgi:MFS-type transporter involved in bile tolerance (Atg22 family)
MITLKGALRQTIHLSAFAIIVVMFIPTLILLCMEKEAHRKTDYDN